MVRPINKTKAPKQPEPEKVAELTEAQLKMLETMTDNSNIEMRMRVRKMSHVERASPDHCKNSYVLLTPQLILVGNDKFNGQMCKFTTIMD
jgi:hypothetical protein